MWQWRRQIVPLSVWSSWGIYFWRIVTWFKWKVILNGFKKHWFLHFYRKPFVLSSMEHSKRNLDQRRAWLVPRYILKRAQDGIRLGIWAFYTVLCVRIPCSVYTADSTSSHRCFRHLVSLSRKGQCSLRLPTPRAEFYGWGNWGTEMVMGLAQITACWMLNVGLKPTHSVWALGTGPRSPSLGLPSSQGRLRLLSPTNPIKLKKDSGAWRSCREGTHFDRGGAQIRKPDAASGRKNFGSLWAVSWKAAVCQRQAYSVDKYTVRTQCLSPPLHEFLFLSLEAPVVRLFLHGELSWNQNGFLSRWL
jgi:hypothetical protein